MAGKATGIREARLQPECAEVYPTLPARLWTSARKMAGLVADYAGAKDFSRRLLSEDCFDFRGGGFGEAAAWERRRREDLTGEAGADQAHEHPELSASRD